MYPASSSRTFKRGPKAWRSTTLTGRPFGFALMASLLLMLRMTLRSLWRKTRYVASCLLFALQPSVLNHALLLYTALENNTARQRCFPLLFVFKYFLLLLSFLTPFFYNRTTISTTGQRHWHGAFSQDNNRTVWPSLFNQAGSSGERVFSVLCLPCNVRDCRLPSSSMARILLTSVDIVWETINLFWRMFLNSVSWTIKTCIEVFAVAPICVSHVTPSWNSQPLYTSISATIS